jgi:hypothetical protein
MMAAVFDRGFKDDPPEMLFDTAAVLLVTVLDAVD